MLFDFGPPWDTEDGKGYLAVSIYPHYVDLRAAISCRAIFIPPDPEN